MCLSSLFLILMNVVIFNRVFKPSYFFIMLDAVFVFKASNYVFLEGIDLSV